MVEKKQSYSTKGGRVKALKGRVMAEKGAELRHKKGAELWHKNG